MKPEKVELSSEAVSYIIEVDTRDLSLEESLASRYARYSQRSIAEPTPTPTVTPSTTNTSRNQPTITSITRP
jgi:hypothetical protein